MKGLLKQKKKILIYDIKNKKGKNLIEEGHSNTIHLPMGLRFR